MTHGPHSIRIVGPTKVEVSGKILTSFAGTNYLGLSFHPRILEALAISARASGLGLGASRKTTGNTAEVLELECAVSNLCGVDAAIVTSSGTLSNAGLLEGLRGAVDHWLIDDAAHASFTSFLPVSGASVHQYRHLDAEDLVRTQAGLRGRVAIFTDAVFPLTGEIAPLRDISDRSGDALLVFDEAHSLGVFGDKGQGLVASMGLCSSRTLVTATFSKALGCTGGVILGATAWVERIREQSSILASTSALSPALARAAVESLAVLRDEPERLDRLRSHTRIMRTLAGLPDQGPAAPIFSRGDTPGGETAAEVSARAREAGFLVPVLTSYPGAPAGGLLRWIVSSEHAETEIRTVSAILGRLII